MLLGALPALASPPAGELPAPLITALVPRGGPVLGETTVTIRGNNLHSTQACRFGNGPQRAATVQAHEQPSPSVLCTTPRQENASAPSSGDQPVSLSQSVDTWLSPASLLPESADRTSMLGGQLNFRFYSSKTLGVEPVVGPGGSLVKVYASGIGEYGAANVLLEGRCRFGATPMQVLKVSAEFVTCQAPALRPPPARPVEVALALNGQDFVAAGEGEATFEYAEAGGGAGAASAPLLPLVMLHDLAKSPASLERLAAYLTHLAPNLQVPRAPGATLGARWASGSGRALACR